MTSRARKKVLIFGLENRTTPRGCKNLIRIIKQRLAYFAQNHAQPNLRSRVGGVKIDKTENYERIECD